MTAERWLRIERMVAEAEALPEAERAAWLDGQCGEDEPMRRQIEGILAAFNVEDDRVLEQAIGRAALSAASATEYATGGQLGPYHIDEAIGKGGMGIVYRAHRSDQQFQQSVAIKVVRTGSGSSAELLARFRLERQLLANISHPNIARLLDGGLTPDGLPYLVMEYIDGTNLLAFAEQNQLALAPRLKLLQQVCGAIGYAHQNLIVHRDLKPGNILVTAEGEVKLLDFGIAKLLDPQQTDQTLYETVAAERLMTPDYASPEQIRGDAITTATDIYGLGLLLYELITGERPFVLSNLSQAEREQIITARSPVPPSLMKLHKDGGTKPVPRRQKLSDLDRIVLKALHKAPERRYSSALELSADLGRYLGGFPVVAQADSFQYRAGLFLRRHKAAVAATALVVLTVFALSIMLALQVRRAEEQKASAEAVSQFLTGLFNNARPDATQGRSTSARDLLDTGVIHLNQNWHGDPLAKARLLSSLGSVYYQIGALDQATQLLKQAKTIYLAQGKSQRPELADVLNSLGESELDQGDYVDSLKNYSESVRLFEETRPQSAELSDAMDGLSGILWKIGNYKESEKYHLRSVSMATRVMGPEADMTMVDKNNLSVLYVDMGRFHEAETIDRELLAARLRHYGEENTHTTSSMDHLGVVLEHQGRFAEALPLLERALTLRLKIYGGRHPKIASSLLHLSHFYQETGDGALAEQYARQALSMTRSLQSENSSDTASAEDQLGMVLLLKGEPAQARLLVESALRTTEAQQIKSVPVLSKELDHLGQIDLAQDRLPSAEKNLRNALTLEEGFFPASDNRITATYLHLGSLEETRGDRTAARTCFIKALALAHADGGEPDGNLTREAERRLASLEATPTGKP